ncbi:hypothetical protein CU098_011507 [Rhizopus stolonifer]|uniref:TLC domain-containing protein n=1 Tax=Rhizopus stolonifer TaxID=4846 RepID=A0A367KEH4_RHIST|nr:hypothetical protein CU098_011507 [Rhizopus stolonifer]
MDKFGYVLDQLSLSTLRYHWQTVLTSAFMFAIVYEISRIFSPILFPKTFQYFLWDTIIAIYFYKYQGISMVIHGIASFSVFIFSFRPFINYYGAVFLMYEVSTIFLNFHWFMDKLGWTGSKIQLMNGIVLLSTFFGARVVFGPYMSYKLWNDIYTVKDDVPLRYWIVYGTANFATTCLNFWWFSQMIAMLRKRFPAKEQVAKHK